MSSVQDRINEVANEPRAGLMERAMCIRISWKKIGRVKKVGAASQVAVERENQLSEIGIADLMPPAVDATNTEEVPIINGRVDTDLEMLRVSKYIIDSPEFDAIRQFESKVKRYMLTKSSPAPCISSAVYMVGLDQIPDVDMTLVAFQKTYNEELVPAFIDAYPRIIADAKERLKDLFNETDYPEVEKLQSMFNFTFQYVSYGVSEKLKTISQALYNRELQKNAETYADAEESIKTALRVGMKDMFEKLIARLTGGEDGKRRNLGPKALNPMKEFLDVFNARNIAQDGELEKIASKARQLLEGVDPADLKGDDGASLRESIVRGFAELEPVLNALVEDTPDRKMRLDFDEEEVA